MRDPACSTSQEAPDITPPSADIHLDLRAVVVAAREEERRRLSLELHDEIGQQLTALLLGLRALEVSSPLQSPARTHLTHLIKVAEQIDAEIDRLGLELRPVLLDELGLYTALPGYLDAWSQRSGIGVDLHCSGLERTRLPPVIETAVFRILQEGLTNVLKHAHASRVSLVLQRRTGWFTAVLEDDGTGFDPEALRGSRGRSCTLGLVGMRERATTIGGSLEIESEPGSGTTLFVRIPLTTPSPHTH